MIRRSVGKQANIAIAMMCAMTLLILPLAGLAEDQGAESEKTEGVLFYPFTNCFGEPILFNYTIHSVSKEGKDVPNPPNPDKAFHVNQINVDGSGVGLPSGNQNILAGSPCNIVPAAGDDYDYLCHVTIIGKEGGLAKSTTTFASDGPGGDSADPIQQLCINPGTPPEPNE
jgi:hypothetical protein